MMGHVINQARVKQRSLVVALFDLKNAFGEVHHNLIQEVLSYHHAPEHIQCFVRNLNTDFKTSIITHDFNTPFITIGRGVLQGDCLSPRLFNLCFNTFKVSSMVPSSLFGLAAVVSGQENESQLLLNRFTLVPMD